MAGAHLPRNNRKADQEKNRDSRQVTTLAIAFDKDDAEQIRRLAAISGNSMREVGSRLLSYALEKLMQEKKERDGRFR